MKLTLKSISNKAKINELEVEHILKAAKNQLEGLPELLKELSITLKWDSDLGQKELIPLKKWADVAISYCEESYIGLAKLLQKEGNEDFILGLIEELHSEEAVQFIIERFHYILIEPQKDLSLAVKIASTLNITLCFKPEIRLDLKSEKLLSNFCLQLATEVQNHSDKAVAILVLRAVGDSDTLEGLRSFDTLNAPWETVLSLTTRKIKQRIKGKG